MSGSCTKNRSVPWESTEEKWKNESYTQKSPSQQWIKEWQNHQPMGAAHEICENSLERLCRAQEIPRHSKHSKKEFQSVEMSWGIEKLLPFPAARNGNKLIYSAPQINRLEARSEGAGRVLFCAQNTGLGDGTSWVWNITLQGGKKINGEAKPAQNMQNPQEKRTWS